MSSIIGTSLSIKSDNTGQLIFDNDTNYSCIGQTYNITTNDTFILNSTNNIDINSDTGNLTVNVETGKLNLTSHGDYSDAITINASSTYGGIFLTAGESGINLNTINGDIDILSQGANINVGVSPVGTSIQQHTQNINMECFNDYSVNSGDMYFVSSDVLSFISQTGDISFGSSSTSNPIIKFNNGNLLVNQKKSPYDYQLDVALTDSSTYKNGYNGIIVTTNLSNVASDLTLQTSNTLGDGTQCILSMGSFGNNNTQSIFASYTAYQTGNMIIRTDSNYYDQDSLDSNNGKDFIYSDIGRNIYWPITNRTDTIIRLSSTITPINDSSNVVVSGTYNGETSRVYLLIIDSIGTRNTFKWSNNGGSTYQEYLIPITLNPYLLDNNIYVNFQKTYGFIYNQQFTFQTKITAIVGNNTSILNPEQLQLLQSFYSYINTTTASDLVIKTNNIEKFRITADGSIGINNNTPKSTLDLHSNYNKIISVNQQIDGFQINPSIGYLESGGYVIVWNDEDINSNFEVHGQRYMSNGTRYENNFKINTNINTVQSYPTIAGKKEYNSNHFIVSWTNNNSNTYNIYFQIYHNNIPIRKFDILIINSNNIISNARCAGLYNGNYIIVWDQYDGTGNYNIYGQLIGDDGSLINNSFKINPDSPSPPLSPFSRRYPFVAGLPSNDTYNPNGFVVGYMCAITNLADPQYTISVRLFSISTSTNNNNIITTVTPTTPEIQITSISNNTYSNISDGLLSLTEINNNIVNGLNGGFIITFYRSYLADTNLYNIGDQVLGLTSGATATIQALNPASRTITLKNTSNRFLVSEQIQINSTVLDVGIIIEKINTITFPTLTSAIITLDIGSDDIVAYRFNSNLSSVSNAIWVKQINTSPLYNDLERYTGNSAIFQYKRPMSYVTTDNYNTALITWTTNSIPNIYYQLINIDNGAKIGLEHKVTTEYNGLKQRNQVATRLQSIQGNDYGFVICWDNESLDLQNTGIYQQLIGYNHSMLNLEDGNSYFIFNHYNQCGIGTNDPESSLHIKTRLNNSTNSINNSDPANPATIKLQNTSKHIITKQDLQSIEFIDGSNNVLNKIQSINSLRYDDLYPQPTNLIGFYKFDENLGTQVIDYSTLTTNRSNISSYRTTNGILNNFDIETCWVSGIINNSLLFNGSNSYVFIENAASNNLNTVLENYSKLSISMWINIPSTIINGTKYDIISNGGNLNLAGTYLLNVSDTSNTGSMVLTSNIIVHQPLNTNVIYNIGLLGTTKLNDSKWHHIVETVSINNSNCSISMYVDGKLENSIRTPGDITVVNHSSIKTYFGSRDGTNTINNYFFRGNMDELRFYNSILTLNEITQLYNYGNPNLPPKASLVICPNSTATNNQSIIIDDDGKINNLSSRPIPYTILSGELTAYKNNKQIDGINTKFINELTVGDIIVLDSINNNIITTNEYTVLSIISNTQLLIDRIGYNGIGSYKTYNSVMRRPSIYTFFDNSDSIQGNIDNYGNMIIGPSKATTMLEINGVSGNVKLVPELTITNSSITNSLYGRTTAINFRSYDAINTTNSYVNLARIDTSHYQTGIDNKSSMRFFINDGTETGDASLSKNLLSLTSLGIGFGDESNPLTLLHGTTNSSNVECSLLLQSSYRVTNNVSSIFDERSNIYFGGGNSINDTIGNIKNRVLCSISGSKSTTDTKASGRLDFYTNNETAGIQNRMSILHNGYIGINNQTPGSHLTLGGSMSLPIISITNTNSPYLLNDTHYTIVCNITSGNITITLPLNTSSISGRIYVLKQYKSSGSFTLNINPNGSNIDMVSTNPYVVNTLLSFIKLQSNGTNWWIVG
jgi:hypothetical protein